MTTPLNLSRRPPVVTDADRRWALEQCPSWCEVRDDLGEDPFGESDGELVDDGGMLDEGLDDDERKPREPLRKARARGVEQADGSVTFAPADIEPGERFAPPNWAKHVDEQIVEFERAFGKDRDSAASWSKRWRGFFSKCDPLQRFPNSKPLPVPPAGYVFLKPGTALHRVALGFATSAEQRSIWATHGVQFPGDDPTLAAIRAAVQHREAA